MAQQLWLLRHGEAVPHGDGPDDDRRLTERGCDQSHAAGRALGALGVTFQLVLTSPKVRARRTADLACEHLGVEPVVHEPLRQEFGLDEALALLRATGDDRRLLLVGHEPDFSQLVHDLTGARIALDKGGLAAIRMDGPTGGRLIALLRPRETDRLAGTAGR